MDGLTYRPKTVSVITESLWVWHTCMTRCRSVNYSQSLELLIAAVSSCCSSLLLLTLCFHAYSFLAYEFETVIIVEFYLPIFWTLCRNKYCSEAWSLVLHNAIMCISKLVLDSLWIWFRLEVRVQLNTFFSFQPNTDFRCLGLIISVYYWINNGFIHV